MSGTDPSLAPWRLARPCDLLAGIRPFPTQACRAMWLLSAFRVRARAGGRPSSASRFPFCMTWAGAYP